MAGRSHIVSCGSVHACSERRQDILPYLHEGEALMSIMADSKTPEGIEQTTHWSPVVRSHNSSVSRPVARLLRTRLG